LITEYDYFLKSVKKQSRSFFIERYGNIGEQYMKPSTFPDKIKAAKEYPWMRDQTAYKR
jgi:hypothetical protein